MLKKGTIPVVDEYLIRAIKYALDQMGISADTLIAGRRRRSTLNDALPADYGEAAGGDAYNGYFTVIAENRSAEGKITSIRVVNGINPDDPNCGLSDLYGKRGIIPTVSMDVSNDSYGEIALILEVVDSNHVENRLVFCTPDAKSAGYENFVSIAYFANNKISQMWKNGAVYWGERFFI